MIVKIICTIMVCGVSITRGEVFTAISDCEPLLETHRVVIDDLDQYVHREEKRLQLLRKQIETFRTEYESAMEDVPNYLGNPINAFTLIKRLTNDLSEIDRRVKMGADYIRNMTTDRNDVKMPTHEDLVGAASALSRLQATYRLQVKELAEGVLNGVSYSSSMSAGDCFELGRALYENGDFYNTAAWMTEALRKYREEKNDAYLFTEVDILDYGSWSYYSIGDLNNAKDWTIKLLELEPSHSRAQGNLKMFEEKTASEPQDTQQEIVVNRGSEYENYDEACRGDLEISPAISKRLSCFYLTENHPFLRLAPIKAEKLYDNPEAYMFYDVISDVEIEHVQTMAKPRFERAFVHDKETGGMKTAQYRISKVAWLDDWESPVVARISRRVADFSGLSMDTSELLQIANYGIGGHYEPHYDCGLKQDVSFLNSLKDNRIATVLFYLSEVAQGGATVFPKIGVSVFPVKNSALFWYNLHPSGEANRLTIHAACPVLRGSKWVANKWIHMKGQELLKQCTLEYQPEETDPPTNHFRLKST